LDYTLTAYRNHGSRGFTAAALFTPTLFRCVRVIHGAIYFEDVGQRSPVPDVAIIVQYNTIGTRSSHAVQPTIVPRQLAWCPQTNPQTDSFSVY